MAQRTTKRLPTTGVVIRAWRIFRGFSSTGLAEKSGVRLGYLSEIEHDRKIRPYEDYLEKLADALRVPLKDILGRQMPPEKKEDAEAEEEDQAIYDQALAREQQAQKASSDSTLLNSPFFPSPQKILVRRLAVLEKNLEAAEKNLQDAKEELHGLRGLVADMQREE